MAKKIQIPKAIKKLEIGQKSMQQVKKNKLLYMHIGFVCLCVGVCIFKYI